MDRTQSLGERLKKERKKMKKTQKQLAQILECSHNCISSYEKNLREPSLYTLKRYAECFNCSIDYLVFGTSRTYPSRLQHSFKRLSASEQERLIDVLESISELVATHKNL